ncbi:MAG: hypothetical protein R3F49_04410 [Planctomycetota bacterium]
MQFPHQLSPCDLSIAGRTANHAVVRSAPRRSSALSSLLAAVLAACALSASNVQAQCSGPDDAFEDNDTCATALPVGLPFVQSNLWVHRYDPDLFLVTVPNGRQLRVFADFVDGEGDVDLVLYEVGAACGDLWSNLRSGRSNSNDETILWTNSTGAPKSVIVQVEIWRGSIPECNRYNLSISAEVPNAACEPLLQDDGLEDNDTCATAIPLPLGMTVGLWASKTDEDFYRIVVPPNETLDVTLNFDHSRTDVDLFLFDAAGPCGGGYGSGELERSFTETNEEHIAWRNTATAPREVIVHVDVYQWHSCNSYSMTASLSGAGVGVNYCTANPNQTGVAGRISGLGSDRVVDNHFILQADRLPTNTVGSFIASRNRGWSPGSGGSAGALCLGGELARFGAVLPTGSLGRIESQINLGAIPLPSGPVGVLAGETWRFQGWFRDRAGNVPTSNLTDGLEVTFR